MQIFFEIFFTCDKPTVVRKPITPCDKPPSGHDSGCMIQDA